MRRIFRPAVLPRVLALLPAWLLMVLLARPAAAQNDFGLPQNTTEEPDRWLGESKWTELRFGLSIREPKRAIRVPDTPQGDAMRWALDDGTRVSLSFASGMYQGIKHGKIIRLPAKIDLLKKQIGDEMKLATAGTVLNTRADQVIVVGPLVGVINYFVVKPSAKGATPFLSGFALLQLDDSSVAVLRLEAKPDNIVQAVCTFECMVHSVSVEPAKEVNRRIHQWFVNAETLMANLTQQDRLSAMRDDRLFRVLEEGRDLGYVRIWQRFQDKAFYATLKERLGKDGEPARLDGIDRFEAKGNAVIVQSYFAGRGAAMQRLYEAIDVPGQPIGYWQIKNALRYKQRPNHPGAGTWVETGVRGVTGINGQRVDHLQLTREGTAPMNLVDFVMAREEDPKRRLRYPSAIKKKPPAGNLSELGFPTPQRAFLSMVDAQLMPALLPNEEKTYCFMAYHPDSSRVYMRLMRVQPRPNGGKTIYVRPTLDMSEQALIFNRNNDLVSWTFPDGRELRQTNREELARIWGVKLRDKN